MVRKGVQFSVPLVKGKDRPRFRRNGWAYTTKETKNAEDAIRAAFTTAAHGADRSWSSYEPYFGEGPVILYIQASKPLPKSLPKRIFSIFFTVKPDADNIAKLVMDALNKVAYKDDSQVVELTVVKADRTRLTEEETFVRLAAPHSRELLQDE